MHSSNAYLIRAMEAERQLAISNANGHKLALAYRDSLERHRQALGVVEELATVATTRRHRALSWVSARLGLKDINTPQIVTMLTALKAARLASEPSPAASPEPPAPAPQEPPEPSGAEKLRVIRGGRDA